MEKQIKLFLSEHEQTKKVFKSATGFYGTYIRLEKDGKIHIALDGACGFSSMQRLAESIGIKLKWNKESDRYTNHSFYTAIID